MRQGLGGSGDLCYLERRGEGRILFFERKKKKNIKERCPKHGKHITCCNNRRQIHLMHIIQAEYNELKIRKANIQSRTVYHGSTLLE